MPPEIQALLFDTYGTVVDWRTAVLAAVVEVGRARGLTVPGEQVVANWEPRPIQDRVNAGTLPWMTMEQIHRRAAAAPRPCYTKPPPHRRKHSGRHNALRSCRPRGSIWGR